MTGKSVYVTTDYREKQLQRALLQYSKPENANLVREALRLAGREDLIGNGPECLVRAAFGQSGRSEYKPQRKNVNGKKDLKKNFSSKKRSGFGSKMAKNAKDSKKSVKNKQQKRKIK